MSKQFKYEEHDEMCVYLDIAAMYADRLLIIFGMTFSGAVNMANRIEE